MSNEVSPDQMQARIQQARREAENLKDRIKRKKDELADGTRKCLNNNTPELQSHYYSIDALGMWQLQMFTDN